MRVLATERQDFVEPHIPTGLVEVWQPKAAFADQPRKWKGNGGRAAFADPEAYLWLTLGPEKKVEELRWLSDFHHLETDDYRMEDIVNVERRALDREVQSPGFLEGEVDQVQTEAPNIWVELLPHLTGIGFAALGFILLMTLRG